MAAKTKESAVTFNLEPSVKTKLEKVAKSQDRSVAYIVRSAVEKLLAEQAAA